MSAPSCTKWKVLALLCLVLLIITVSIVALPLFAFGYIDAMVNGLEVVLEEPSPDGRYTAYITEEPSMDPPNQSLMIERADQSRFLRIAKLVGDVDSIEKIVWSPDSSIVVYHSRLYLTAVRPSDWSIARVYLGREWRRHQPQRRTTFSGAGPWHEVEEIGFPDGNGFIYRLKNDARKYRVKMDFPEVEQEQE